MPPALPSIPALENDDSMLTRRFGKEVVNYYAGSALNRFSFLRADGAFLRKAAAAPFTRFVALSDLNPLTVDSGSRLARFSLSDVSPLIGEQPFVLGEEEMVKQWDSTKKTPILVFLGMVEGKEGESIESSDHGVIAGKPLFAVDVTARNPYEKQSGEFLKSHIKSGGQLQANPRAMTLEADDAAMFAQSRSIIDWNLRIPFCAGCGNPTLSVQAGYKRVCPPTDIRGNPSSPTTLPSCPSRKGVNNIAFPRTDPTMIAAIVSADGTRVLLGRQKSWPDNMYSTLAGFLEPGESIEEAVRREAWEESGVKVGRVVVHSSQPWPYPASLMIGAIAQTLPGKGEKIYLNDKELDNAKWFEFDEIRTALETSAGALHLPPPEGYKEGTLRLPPQQAIANRLITAVVNGFLSGVPKM